ncbi:MAG TPA: hypothetical protein VEC39_20370 [Vicinamibacterales bacterium]|nr:hypothetical protein [Vicinamibacterales bacterium]
MAGSFAPRTVGMIAVAAAAAGWLGSSLAQDVREPAPPAARTAPRPLGANISVPRAEKLREQLPRTPQPGRGRNPFLYGRRSATRSSSQPVEIADAVVAQPAPTVPIEPPGPVFKLSGIASRLEGELSVLTAIIIDNGALVFAKAGDKLSNGYSVLRVDELSVTLADATGATQTIRLP